MGDADQRDRRQVVLVSRSGRLYFRIATENKKSTSTMERTPGRVTRALRAIL
jgi:hypothetical protein